MFPCKRPVSSGGPVSPQSNLQAFQRDVVSPLRRALDEGLQTKESIQGTG